MEDKKLIEALSNAFGPSGHEDEVCKILEKELDGIAKTKESPIRDLFVNFNKNGHKKVMLDAHIDEVGIMVQAIRPNGLLEFLTLGSWQNNTLPGTKINILNSKGNLVEGVVSSIPPHFIQNHLSGAEPSVSDMTIDIGATSEKEVRELFNIEVGAFGAPQTVCKYNELNHVFSGKAFDCRIGVSVMTEIFKTIDTTKLNVELCGAYTSSEEVGERGATSAYLYQKPDLVICFEGAPADDTFTPEYKIQTGLSRGPMIRHMDRSIISNHRFIEFAKETAKKNNIPLQLAVRSGGGVNAAIYQQYGVPSIVISVPVRYIHSPNCYTSYDDYLNAVKLAKNIIEDLTDDIIESF